MELRMTSALYAEMRNDLGRTHVHALERVGFAFGRFSANRVYLHDYESVPDDNYLESARFGALIDDKAILGVMQRLRRQRGRRVGAFHVHVHEHRGAPWFSPADLSSLPDLVPPLQRMDPTGASGLLLLSHDHALARVWVPGSLNFIMASSVVVVGAPTRVWRQGGQRRVR